MLGEVIGLDGDSGGPLYLELSLAHAIADPPETHVHSFGAFGFYGVVGDAGGGGVVAVDNGGELRPAHFFESGAQAGGDLAVMEEAGGFGLN